MNQSNAQNMQSYPSPNAIAADGGAPFYSPSQQPQAGLSNSDDLQLAARLSRGIAPMMNTGAGGLPDGQEQGNQGNITHQYEHNNQPQSELRSPSETMEHMGMPYATPDGSMAPRKRSKVSRACDECRRKKIRCDATGEVGDENCSSCKRVGTQCQFSRVPMKRGPSKGYIKELADRLHTLEGVMQAGEIPVGQYLPQHDSPLQQQRRVSDEFSPPPHTGGSMVRKRTYSSTSGDFSSPYQPQKSHAPWATQETPRHLPHPSPSFSTSHPAPTAQMFREPNYSPNGLQPVPQWRNPPEPLRRQSSSFESMAQTDQGSSEYTADWDDSIVDGYYTLIHPTYPLLSTTKAALSSKIASCPPPLREAFYEALHVAVRSFPAPSTISVKQRSTKKVTQLIAASQLENSAARSISTNLVYLQTMLLMAIEAANRGPPTADTPGAALQSVWLGSAVGLAYSMKLHVSKEWSESHSEDTDSEEMLARRIWWSLTIMDRWHASSTSSPLLVPESSAILYLEDQTVLGDAVYHLARLSIVLGHFSAIDLVPSDLPALSLPPVPILGMLMRGELERCRETLPSSLLTSSNAPLIHLSYWALSIQMLLRLPESEAAEILAPALKIVTHLAQNAGLVSPLTHHATVLAATSLIELSKDDATKEQAEAGLKTLLEGRIAPSNWDVAIREMILKKQHSSPAGTGGATSADAASGQHSLLALQGLQHLADLATATKKGPATGENRNETEKVGSDPSIQQFRGLRAAVKCGYLTSISR